MTENNEFYENDDFFVNDPNSPFYGLPTADVKTEVDNNIGIEDALRAKLGVESIGDIFVEIENVDVERLRGNRFSNIVDAIVYLADAGVLQFGDVTLDDDLEIGIAIGYGEDDE